MKVKAVLLDFDGVLLDSWDLGYQIVCTLLEEKGVNTKDPETDKKLRMIWGLPALQMMQNLLPNEDKDSLLKRWLAIEGDRAKDIALVAGARESLNYLKRQKIIHGIATNRGDTLLKHLIRTNIIEKMDFIATRSEGSDEQPRIHQHHLMSELAKPDPRFFQLILNWLKTKNIKAEETIYIEDSLISSDEKPNTIESVRSLKITPLVVCTGPINTPWKWINWAGQPQKDILQSIADLPQWIEKYGKE